MVTNAPTNPSGTTPPGSPPPRIRKTHTSDKMAELLRNLPLILRLQKNKAIETKNTSRLQYQLDKETDPAANIAPISPVASYITITDSEIGEISRPVIFSTLLSELTMETVQRVQDFKDREAAVDAKSNKRKAELDAEAAKDRAHKRNCVNGDNYEFRNPNKPAPVTFPEVMYHTEIRRPLPIEFFTRNNLARICAGEGSSMACVKGNALPGESKGTMILDIKRIHKDLGT
ncbi:hypothetical protein BJ165DRAFT_1334316, partial [Panaeolus papilionaceus]